MNRSVRALVATTLTLSLSAVLVTGCGKSDTPAPEPAKPAQTSAPVKAAEVPAAPKPAAQKPAVKKSVPTAKKPHAVPGDWTVLVDPVRLYGFAVPAGTRDHHESKDGVDVYVAEVPKPHDIQVFAVAYKDRTRTREDLLVQAKHVLELMGNDDVKMGEAKELTADYALADATCKSDGKAWKVRVLVATDVTDNYILLVGSPESEFEANEATIDTIWGSFEMLSGGASGESN